MPLSIVCRSLCWNRWNRWNVHLPNRGQTVLYRVILWPNRGICISTQNNCKYYLSNQQDVLINIIEVTLENASSFKYICDGRSQFLPTINGMDKNASKVTVMKYISKGNSNRDIFLCPAVPIRQHHPLQLSTIYHNLAPSTTTSNLDIINIYMCTNDDARSAKLHRP